MDTSLGRSSVGGTFGWLFWPSKLHSYPPRAHTPARFRYMLVLLSKAEGALGLAIYCWLFLSNRHFVLRAYRLAGPTRGVGADDV